MVGNFGNSFPYVFDLDKARAAAATSVKSTNPFAAPGKDPFAAPGKDPFTSPGKDPFAVASSEELREVPTQPISGECYLVDDFALEGFAAKCAAQGTCHYLREKHGVRLNDEPDK